MKVCSSSLNSGYGLSKIFLKSGLPEKSSPSTHTSPALKAVFSVSEILGSKPFDLSISNIGLVMTLTRASLLSNITAKATTGIHMSMETP